MAEEVQTGGVMQFKYKDSAGKLDDERKDSIAKGYEQAEERKRLEQERKRKRMIWISTAIILLIVIIILFFMFK